MARNNNKATAPAAKPAKVAPLLRASAIVAKHGMAGQARAMAVTGPAAASAKRYGRQLGSLSAGVANATFGLTPLGKAAVAANGCIGAKGQPTVMGLFALGLGNAIAANGGQPVTGQALCLAVLGNPQLMAAMQRTKAQGVHLIPAHTTAMGWAGGYANGLCRPAHGLAKKG